MVLSDYSAVPVDVAELREFGRVWSVVPKTPGGENAADLVRKLWQAPGCAVLGSLTLALPMHSPVQKLLFAGGLGVAAKCAPTTGGPFAVLTKPPPAVAVEAPKPEPPKTEAPKVEVVEREAEVLPAVLTTPDAPKNGASKKRYETPVVIDHPPIPKEPLA